MAIVATTIPAMQDLMDNADARELFIVSKEMERPPYWFAEEGLNARLIKALRVVQEDRITPNSDGSYTVEGSEHRQYRCAESCSCPQSQKGKSKWCYHMVSVALYVEWRKRCGTWSAPALPLPPVTPDERLAQAPVTPDTPFELHLILQEDRMADDAYIPEPEAPVAVLEPPVPTQAVTTPATSSLDARGLLESMTAWKEQRQILARYIKEQLTDGVDYYTLRIKGRDTKPTLSKAGSEKFLAIFKLTATFQQDQATWTMLGAKEGVLCYTCTLLTRDGQVVGEGRGARTLAQDQGDINKAVKMAQKSAQIDAILRTGCLSDVFTHDIEDLQETPPTPAKATTTSQDLRQRIWAQVQKMDGTVRTRDQVEGFIKARTGMDLHPDFYTAILDRLEGRA